MPQLEVAWTDYVSVYACFTWKLKSVDVCKTSTRITIDVHQSGDDNNIRPDGVAITELGCSGDHWGWVRARSTREPNDNKKTPYRLRLR